MTGLKYKLAHRRADKDKWSATTKGQRKRLVKLLRDFIIQLEKEPVQVEIEYKNKIYKGEAMPNRKPVMMRTPVLFTAGIKAGKRKTLRSRDWQMLLDKKSLYGMNKLKE